MEERMKQEIEGVITQKLENVQTNMSTGINQTLTLNDGHIEQDNIRKNC